MDSDPPPRTSGSALASSPADQASASPHSASGRSPSLPSESSEEPFSSNPIYDTAAPLLGFLVAICTMVIPLASVLGSRPNQPVVAAPPPA